MYDILTEAKSSGSKVRIDTLIYDPRAKRLLFGDQEIVLEPRTIELLEVLLSSVDTAISAEEIIATIWKSTYISKTVLTNRISTLRSILKTYLPNSDVSKLLVTYPKKGYYISLDKVSLLEPEPTKVIITPNQRAYSSATRLHAYYLSAIVFLCIAVAFWGFQSRQAGIERDNNRSSAENITIPIVKILLNRVTIKDVATKQYRKEVKTILLDQQVRYPYTDVANQDAPTYFLAPLDNSKYWPGAKNSLFSDYKLNIQLSSSEQVNKIHTAIDLVYSTNNKLAYRAEYVMNTSKLTAEMHKVSEDMIVFFGLPKAKIMQKNTQSIQQLINLSESELQDKLLSQSKVSELEVSYLSRQMILANNLEPEIIKKWINVIKRSFRYYSEETGIWLGLLYFKVHEYDLASEALSKTVFNKQIDNAFLYLLLSNIALENNQADKFRLNYLQSFIALKVAIPSKEIFKRLSEPETHTSCLSAWLSLNYQPNFQEKVKPWIDIFDGYCQRAEKFLK